MALITSFYTLSVKKLRIIRIFVTLRDNMNQGIVPVSGHLGNGENPNTNLY
jgi:hypothetical protein